MHKRGSQYPTLGVLLAAGIIYFRGYPSYLDKSPSSGIRWWATSAVMLFAYGLGAVLMQRWASVEIIFAFLFAAVGWIAWRLEDKEE
jgi:hypothetical protein